MVCGCGSCFLFYAKPTERTCDVGTGNGITFKVLNFQFMKVPSLSQSCITLLHLWNPILHWIVPEKTVARQIGRCRKIFGGICIHYYYCYYYNMYMHTQIHWHVGFYIHTCWGLCYILVSSRCSYLYRSILTHCDMDDVTGMMGIGLA
jgi:hypothetical protein